MFVKIGGKGNISRYRTFFKHFDVPIHVITDLDALSNGFEHLTSVTEIRETRGKLINTVKEYLTGPSTPSRDKVKEIARSRSPRELWASAQNNLAIWKQDKTDIAAQAIEKDLMTLFDAGNGDSVLALLTNPPTDEIRALIEEVVGALADENTYVLRRGDLEHYCRTDSKNDKVATAMKFCEDTATLDGLKTAHGEAGDAVAAELKGIFASIFQETTIASDTTSYGGQAVVSV